jgi:hypothetical protein
VLLAGTVDGRWRDPDRVAAYLRGGERYRLYSLTRFLGMATGTKPRLVKGEGYGYAQVLSLAPVPKSAGVVIGVGGTWNALPRVPTIERNDQAVYREVVSAFLKAKGVAVHAPRITQVLRVDLGGDGTDEVLISASSGGPSEMFNAPKKGTYSLVLVRKLVNGRVRTFEVAGTYLTKDLGPDEPPLIEILRVDAVLDLTGDGRMEVLVGAEGYEWSSIRAYRVTDSGTKLMFHEGVGA